MKREMNADNMEIDESRLGSPGQLAIRGMVKSLPEETVSMTWRSSLNEQLLLVAAKRQKKRRLLWFATPALGVSMVTALAFVLMIHPAPNQTITLPDRGIESAILDDHHNSTLSNEVSTAGLNLNEATSYADEDDSKDGIGGGVDSESL